MSDNFGMQGGGTNSVGFTLIDGEGTTANGSAVDLGGDITQDVVVKMESGDADYPFQLSFLPDGLQNTNYPENKAILFGLRSEDAPTNDVLNGMWQIVSVDGLHFTGLGYTNNDEGPNIRRALIECALQEGVTAAIELEVQNMAVKLIPQQLTYGGYGAGSTNGYYLDFNIEDWYFNIGDINGDNNGTYISIDDAASLIKLTNIPDYADDAAAIGGGLTTGHLYKTTTGGSTFLKIVP